MEECYRLQNKSLLSPSPIINPNFKTNIQTAASDRQRESNGNEEEERERRKKDAAEQREQPVKGPKTPNANAYKNEPYSCLLTFGPSLSSPLLILGSSSPTQHLSFLNIYIY
jgi:hypothetical protein